MKKRKTQDRIQIGTYCHVTQRKKVAESIDCFILCIMNWTGYCALIQLVFVGTDIVYSLELILYNGNTELINLCLRFQNVEDNITSNGGECGPV